MIGGEWAISKGFLQAGLMYELASKYNASMYYTEHRYYGKSKPTKYEFFHKNNIHLLRESNKIKQKFAIFQLLLV